MVEGYGKLVKRILRDQGFKKLRSGKGDHEVWWNPETKQQVTVDGGTRSRFTAQETLSKRGSRRASNLAPIGLVEAALAS